MTEATVITPDTQKTPFNVIGVDVTVLAEGDSGCGNSITRQTGSAGMGPPPHAHDWDETFYVVNGSVDFHVNGKTSHCEAGSLVVVPAGSVHGFNFGPEGGEMLEITGKGSMATQMFAAVDSEIPPGEPDVPKLLNVLDRYGVSVHL